MSIPKGIYKEGNWGKLIHYAERLINICTTVLNEHPVVPAISVERGPLSDRKKGKIGLKEACHLKKCLNISNI